MCMCTRSIISCEFLSCFLGYEFFIFEKIVFLAMCIHCIVRAGPFCDFDFWKATLQVMSSSREVVGAGPGDGNTSIFFPTHRPTFWLATCMHAAFAQVTSIVNHFGAHGGCVGRSLTSGLTFDYRPAWSLDPISRQSSTGMHARMIMPHMFMCGRSHV